MIRTIDGKALKTALILLAVLLPGFAPRGRAADGRRLSLGIAGGYFYPGRDSFRGVYGKSIWPVDLRLGWALSRRLDLGIGARYLGASGHTVLLQPWRPEEAYALRLQVLALRLGLNAWLGEGRLAPFLGAGVQYAFFKEKWSDVPLEAQGRKAGFFAQGGGRFRLGRSFYALLQLDYSFLPAGEWSGVEKKVDLGGLGLSLGVGALLF